MVFSRLFFRHRNRLFRFLGAATCALSLVAVGASAASSVALSAYADGSSSSAAVSPYNGFLADVEGFNEGAVALNMNHGTSFRLVTPTFFVTDYMVGVVGQDNIGITISNVDYSGNLYFDVRGGTQYLFFRSESIGTFALADTTLSITSSGYRGTWNHVRAGWDSSFSILADSTQMPIDKSLVYNLTAVSDFSLGVETSPMVEDDELFVVASPQFFDGIRYLGANDLFSAEYGTWYSVSMSNVYDGELVRNLNPYSWVVPYQAKFSVAADGTLTLLDYWLMVCIVPTDSAMFASGILNPCMPFWFRFGYNYVEMYGGGNAYFGFNNADLVNFEGAYIPTTGSHAYEYANVNGARISYSKYSISYTVPYGNSLWFKFTETMAGYYGYLAENWYYGQYEQGYQAGRLSALNGDVYQNGYDAGYRVGYNDGAMHGGPATTMLALFGSVVSVPINILNGLSPLAIWDTPIISIVLSFMMIGVLLFIVKRFI